MTVKQAIKEIFDVVNAFIKAKSDDGPGGSDITLIEKISIGIQGLDLIKVATGYKMLIDDWRSGSPEKRAEWLHAFNDNFNIPNDELELIIEDMVGKALDLITNFEMIAERKK